VDECLIAAAITGMATDALAEKFLDGGFERSGFGEGKGGEGYVGRLETSVEGRGIV
jgi:hypothetical protein